LCGNFLEIFVNTGSIIY